MPLPLFLQLSLPLFFELDPSYAFKSTTLLLVLWSPNFFSLLKEGYYSSGLDHPSGMCGRPKNDTLGNVVGSGVPCLLDKVEGSGTDGRSLVLPFLLCVLRMVKETYG